MNELARVLINVDNPSIKADDSLCKNCHLCQKACQNEVGVFGFYDVEKTNGNAICINCGRCIQVCPFNAIKPVNDIGKVIAALNDNDKIVVFNTAPAVRVGIGDMFGFPRGEFLEGKMISAIRALGADYVLDVTCGADLTIMEEAFELVERLRNNSSNMPMFTSCCPAWVKMAEIYYPSLLPNLSSAKSPIAMQGAIVKTYFANKMGIDPNKIVNVTVAPCVAKKAEAKRSELNCAKTNSPDVDIVITTVELAQMIKDANIDFNSLEDGSFDSLFGTGSSSGLIFGNTGGVMQAAIRTAYFMLNNENIPDNVLEELEPIRGIENLKLASVDLKVKKIKVAAVSQMSEAKKLIDQILNKEIELDFVEVMACPGGCANGGGQAKVIRRPEIETARLNRNKGLYLKDTKDNKLRYCHENPEIIKLYNDFLITPGSHKAHELLHTTFKDCSGLLEGKND